MKNTPLRRSLALFLCVQPVFWTSNVALAQSLRLPSARQTSPLDPGRSDSAERRSQQEDDDAAVAPAFPAPRFGVSADSGSEGERSRAVPRTPELPPVDAPVDAESYVCGPGDLLMLNFWGVQNFRLNVPVDLEGRAFVPKVGHFDLRGKTLAEARQLMRTSVARLFPRLGFEVSLAQPRTFLVQVVNAVTKPGAYPARAVDRVAAIIDRAGGLGPNASTRRIEVRRRDGTVLGADLMLYKLSGDVKHNPYLLDGDVVRIPYAELAASIDGAVNRPGRYELIGTRDLEELVALAGGFAPTVTRQLPIGVVRRQQDDKQHQELIPFPENGVPAVALRHEDGVRVPGFTELQHSVMVVGAIKDAPPPAPVGGAMPDESSATRRLPFAQGDSVRTILDRVGGVGPLADLTGSYLLRKGQSIPVDLYALVMLRDLQADRPVELGDTLVIPFKRRNVLIQGAVFTPGSYPYNPSYGIDQYLSLAGGRNRFAQPISDVRVVTPDGKTKEYRKDLIIEPGSQLVVPERNYSRTEVVQLIISAAGVLVSGIAVVLAARN